MTAIVQQDDGKYVVTVNGEKTIGCDAVILAVGITAAQRLLETCAPIAAVPETAKWNKLRGVTCCAVRLFFRGALPSSIRMAMRDSPVAVCGPRMGNIPELVETGFCIYDLQRMQDEFQGEDVTALEVDFFRADALCEKSDEEVAELSLRAVSAALEISAIDPSSLADVSVVRARNAVSYFSVGSASWSLLSFAMQSRDCIKKIARWN